MECGKKIYNSKSQAEKRAENLSIMEGKKLYVYKCFGCGKYHLTKKRPAKRSYKRKDGKRNR